MRLRPVDRVNLRTGSAQGAEEVIAWPFVHLVKLVQIEVVEHRLIPRQRLLAREVTFNHRAAAALNGLALCVGNRAVFHIVKRNHRPDGFTFIFKGVNFRHAGGNAVAELVEHRLHVADLRA